VKERVRKTLVSYATECGVCGEAYRSPAGVPAGDVASLAMNWWDGHRHEGEDADG
jgi:hypothetical protein